MQTQKYSNCQASYDSVLAFIQLNQISSHWVELTKLSQSELDRGCELNDVLKDCWRDFYSLTAQMNNVENDSKKYLKLDELRKTCEKNISEFKHELDELKLDTTSGDS